MTRKRAVITLVLVNESVNETDEEIKRELLEWFSEDAISIPWVKEVKNITVEVE